MTRSDFENGREVISSLFEAEATLILGAFCISKYTLNSFSEIIIYLADSPAHNAVIQHLISGTLPIRHSPVRITRCFGGRSGPPQLAFITIA